MIAVIVSYDSQEEIASCLDALANDGVSRIVVVDNASRDDSVSVAREVGGEGVEVVSLDRNTGFAGGCNRGYERGGEDAEFVAFLNPDVRVVPGCLQRCATAMERDPAIGCVAPLLVRGDGITVDSAGQGLKRWTLEVRDRGYGEPLEPDRLQPGPVLAACGALAVFRREALEAVREEAGPFAEHYFCFWEDLELGWRLNNAGWKVWFEPAARAEHDRGSGAEAGSGPLRWRRPPFLEACIVSNRWITLLRHGHGLDLVLRAPVLLIWDGAVLGASIVRRPSLAVHLVKRLPLVWREFLGRRRRSRKRLSDLPC